MPSTIHLQRESPFSYYCNERSNLYTSVYTWSWKKYDCALVINTIALGVITRSYLAPVMIGAGILGRFVATRVTNFAESHIENIIYENEDDSSVWVRISTMAAITYIIGIATIFAISEPGALFEYKLNLPIIIPILMPIIIRCLLSCFGIDENRGKNVRQFIWQFFAIPYFIEIFLLTAKKFDKLLVPIILFTRYLISLETLITAYLLYFVNSKIPSLKKPCVLACGMYLIFKSLFNYYNINKGISEVILSWIIALSLGALSGVTETIAKTFVKKDVLDKEKENLIHKNFFARVLVNYIIKHRLKHNEDEIDITRGSDEFKLVMKTLSKNIPSFYGKYAYVASRSLVEEFFVVPKITKNNAPAFIEECLTKEVFEEKNRKRNVMALLRDAKIDYRSLSEEERAKFNIHIENTGNERLDRLAIQARNIAGRIQISRNSLRSIQFSEYIRDAALELSKSIEKGKLSIPDLPISFSRRMPFLNVSLR